jgi:tight adherence protein B
VRRALAILAFAAVAATASASASADETLRLTQIGRLRPPDRGYVVDLPRHARLVPGDVAVRENGRPVQSLRLMPVAETSAAFGVALVIDASDSMHGRPFRGALAAARRFVARKTPKAEIGVIAFNRSVQVVQPLTADSRTLRRALARPPALAEGTHIYDAVARAVEMLEQKRLASGVVVLLSDGTDTGSRLSNSAVIAAARAKHVRVFTVGLRSPDFSAPSLRALAAGTGASYAEARSTAELETIYDSLGERLASEYLIEYRSTAKEGTRVHLTIAIRGVGSATAAYTAGAPKGLGPYHRSIFDRFWASAASTLFIGLLGMLLAAGAAVALLKRPPGTLVGRLGEYLSLGETPAEPEDRRLLSERLLARTERSLSKTQWWEKFEEELEIASINVPAAQIVVGTAVTTLVVGFMLALVSPVLFLFAAAVPFAVRSFQKRKLTKVRDDFTEQLPDNMQVLASALRAGHSFVGAFAVVANDAPEPARREFQRVVADEQLGVPMEESLRDVARRMDSKDLEQVALLAELQREAGGNMAEVLDTIVDTIRERFDLRRLVQTLTAQGRLARWILSLLPAFLLGIISLLNPGYMQPLFATAGGRVVLVIATGMVVAGSLVIKRIVDIKV